MSVNLFQMYQKRYPALFSQTKINKSMLNPPKKEQEKSKEQEKPKEQEKVAVLEHVKEEPKKETISKLNVIKTEKETIVELEQEETKLEEPSKKINKKPPTIKPRAEDKRRSKTDEELREKMIEKLCQSKKLKSSEQKIKEINDTIEKVDGDESKLRDLELKTRKKLKILKDSYLFIKRVDESTKDQDNKIDDTNIECQQPSSP